MANLALTVACPVCAVRPGEACESNAGGPRDYTHIEQEWLAEDNQEAQGVIRDRVKCP